MIGYEYLPNVLELGDGEYDGVLNNNHFVYESKLYYCECGEKGLTHRVRLIISGDNIYFKLI